MKRTNKKQKIEMILSGQAYIAKCDGGFFFYIKSGGFVRISKELFTEISFEVYMIDGAIA